MRLPCIFNFKLANTVKIGFIVTQFVYPELETIGYTQTEAKASTVGLFFSVSFYSPTALVLWGLEDFNS